METTTFRFVLRERNSFATLLKCAPMSWLLWIVPAYLLKTCVLILGAIGFRKLKLAQALLDAIIWNFRQFPTTFGLRHKMVRSKHGSRIARKRIYRGWLALERLREYGLPRFIDGERPAAHPKTAPNKLVDPAAREN
jgi:hypothetical protein